MGGRIKFKFRTAHRKFTGFGAGLTLVAGRPFSKKTQRQLAACQSHFDSLLSECSHPVFWYRPDWLHLTICPIVNSLERERGFSRLKHSDLANTSRKRKMDLGLRRSFRADPGQLVERIRKRLGRWHGRQDWPNEGEGPSVVEVTLRSVEVIHTGDIVVHADSPVLKRLRTTLKAKPRLCETTYGLHITLGFLLPATNPKVRPLRRAPLNRRIEQDQKPPRLDVVHVTEFLLAHYQSRTLATLYGAIRFNTNGKIIDGGGFDDLNFDRQHHRTPRSEVVE